jgi:hypothetical protein
LVTPPKSLSTMKAVITSCFSPIWSTFCNNQCNKLVTITKLNIKFILILYFLLIHLPRWLLHTESPSYTPRLSEHPLLDATHYCSVFIRKRSAVCTKHLMKCNNLTLEHLKKLLYHFNIHLNLIILITTLHKDLNDSELNSKHMLVLTAWVHMLIFMH